MSKTAHQSKEVKALYRINQFMGHIMDLDSLLQLIMQEASATVAAQASSIALYDPAKKDLRFIVSTGAKGEQIRSIRLPMGQGIIGYAARTRKPLNIADVSKDRRFYSGVDKKTSFKSKSILAVPILYKQRLIGALEVINKKGAASFSKEDLKLLEIVAGQAAIAIENSKLYQRIIQKHASLKNKHQRLIEMQKQMLRMARISAIGDMASRMVHDLRNPLGVVRGYAELMKDVEAKEERQQYSKIITDEIDRLTGMTNEVMDFVKGKTSLLFKEYLLGDFINEITSFLTRDFTPHHIQLEVDARYTGTICMDRFKMQRAIFNISFNARDAMPQGGKFKIETDLVDEWVEIRLSDTGPGIPQEIRERLGQPFVTFGKEHGTGLGMAIVKKVMENHHGELLIDSHQPQEGTFTTAFTIRIPRTPPQECAAPQQGTS